MNLEDKLIQLYTGCPFHDVKARLQKAGLRPTKQRLELGWLLFSKGDRHITADMLYAEAERSKVYVSQATVYNTLSQFREFGLLREIRSEGSKIWYDTNPTQHYHLYDEDTDTMSDLPANAITINQLPDLGHGKTISAIDIVISYKSSK